MPCDIAPAVACLWTGGHCVCVASGGGGGSMSQGIHWQYVAIRERLATVAGKVASRGGHCPRDLWRHKKLLCSFSMGGRVKREVPKIATGAGRCLIAAAAALHRDGP